MFGSHHLPKKGCVGGNNIGRSEKIKFINDDKKVSETLNYLKSLVL